MQVPGDSIDLSIDGGSRLFGKKTTMNGLGQLSNSWALNQRP
jgi:hypothetical protein